MMSKEKGSRTRLFASFRNKNDLLERRDDIVKKMPKKYRFDFMLFLGQYESTLAEGFQDDE